MDDFLNISSNGEELNGPENPAEEIRGDLDDQNLTDDFVIGQDFFIDSSEADMMLAEDEKKSGAKK